MYKHSKLIHGVLSIRTCSVNWVKLKSVADV